MDDQAMGLEMTVKAGEAAVKLSEGMYQLLVNILNDNFHTFAHGERAVAKWVMKGGDAFTSSFDKDDNSYYDFVAMLSQNNIPSVNMVNADGSRTVLFRGCDYEAAREIAHTVHHDMQQVIARPKEVHSILGAAWDQFTKQGSYTPKESAVFDWMNRGRNVFFADISGVDKIPNLGSTPFIKTDNRLIFKSSDYDKVSRIMLYNHIPLIANGDKHFNLQREDAPIGR